MRCRDGLVQLLEHSAGRKQIAQSARKSCLDFFTQRPVDRRLPDWLDSVIRLAQPCGYSS
jgi:hypothetical protein